jgi:hypothetical protein
MVAIDLLRQLEGTGFKLTVIDGGQLKVEPADMLTDDIRHCIKENKKELIRLLLDKKHRTTSRQIVCKAFEYNGVLMATTPESCCEWQGPYCIGCELVTIH